MPGWEDWVGGAVGLVDRAFVRGLRIVANPDERRASDLPHPERMERLAACARDYGDPRLLADPEAFFPTPPTPRPDVRLVRELPQGGRVVEWSWSSLYEPYLPDLRDGWFVHEANRTARARLWLSPTPRPAVVLVHGYGTGHWALEEWVWPIETFRDRGLDVVQFVLPFHAARASAIHRGPPPFPAADPRVTNEGFRQAIWDLRALIAALRADGHGPVGVVGMSLGGCTTALLATVEAELAFAGMLIPLASLADYARMHGRLGDGPQADDEHAAIELANRVVSPFARPPRIAPQRTLVVSAEADRVTGPEQAARLAAHFGTEPVTVRGGHLVQLGISEGFRAVGRLIDAARVLR